MLYVALETDRQFDANRGGVLADQCFMLIKITWISNFLIIAREES